MLAAHGCESNKGTEGVRGQRPEPGSHRSAAAGSEKRRYHQLHAIVGSHQSHSALIHSFLVQLHNELIHGGKLAYLLTGLQSYWVFHQYLT